MTHVDRRIPSLNSKQTDPEVSALLSHDIRSALSQILGASQLLESAELTDENATFVTQIKTASFYINDLLEQARDETGVTAVTELVPAIWKLGTIWSTAAEEKGLQFKMTRQGVIPNKINLPELDFLRIFNNVIGNALKFSADGVLKIALSRGENGVLLIEVADCGPGFSDEALAKLFSKHGRPSESEVEGSGLGLYITRMLVEKAGGEIWAENQPAGGALVRISFPEKLLIFSDQPETRPSKPKSRLPDLSHLRILLAEDNPTNQLVATQMLKKMNAVVETASDGLEAMARFESGDYNLGLIDIEMPRKSGLEVLREMRAREDDKAGMTLLALTAYVLPEHQQRITRAGADGIIAKPLTDISAFGNAILIYAGEGKVADPTPVDFNPDADIQMDIYNGLKEIIGNESMQELLGKVQSDLASVQEGLQAGAAAKDTVPIRANTHILISVAGAIGAVNLQHIAEALNATAKVGNWGDITPETARCEMGIASVLQFVAKELDN